MKYLDELFCKIFGHKCGIKLADNNLDITCLRCNRQVVSIQKVPAAIVNSSTFPMHIAPTLWVTTATDDNKKIERFEK